MKIFSLLGGACLVLMTAAGTVAAEDNWHKLHSSGRSVTLNEMGVSTTEILVKPGTVEDTLSQLIKGYDLTKVVWRSSRPDLRGKRIPTPLVFRGESLEQDLAEWAETVNRAELLIDRVGYFTRNKTLVISMVEPGKPPAQEVAIFESNYIEIENLPAGSISEAAAVASVTPAATPRVCSLDQVVGPFTFNRAPVNEVLLALVHKTGFELAGKITSLARITGTGVKDSLRVLLNQIAETGNFRYSLNKCTINVLPLEIR